MTSLLLVSHGSRDPLAQETTARLADAVADELPGVAVGIGYLELATPTVIEAFNALPGPVVVQPLLFTPAFHATIDLPAQLAERPGTRVAPVLAPDPLLLDALDRRLTETGVAADALVLASAGTSVEAARKQLDDVAADWGKRHGLPCVAAYASAADPDAGAAVRALRDAGASSVVVGSLFVAPGLLQRRAAESALAAGAAAVAEPLADAPELVRLIVNRFQAIVA